jgi:ABC-type multidrug transport system fused ATPase/permease subunit
MFTGFRLSLGIAWLVIVAAEMLTGRKTGVGGFLWNEYNNSNYGNIILCDPDHRIRRLRTRPPDERRRKRFKSQLKPPRPLLMSFLELLQGPKASSPAHQRTEVLQDVNLTIEKGEFVAIVGYSGQGKTTC